MDTTEAAEHSVIFNADYLKQGLPQQLSGKEYTMQEPQDMWILSLGWEDSLEEGTATHFSILAWRIPRTEEPGGLQSIGLQRVDTTENICTRTNTQRKLFLSVKE